MTRTRVLAAVVLLALGVAVGAWWQRPDPVQAQAVTPTLGPVEVGFAQDMAAHHLQAIELCNNLTGEVDQQIDLLCAQIRTSQVQEIGILGGWLTLLDLPQTSTEPMGWMHGDQHSGHGGSPMPGMASWGEVDELRRLSGREAESRFLQLMIRHHHGGIDMAAYAAQHAAVAPVARVATDMVKKQSEETALMEQMLTARGAEPLPYP